MLTHSSLTVKAELCCTAHLGQHALVVQRKQRGEDLFACQVARGADHHHRQRAAVPVLRLQAVRLSTALCQVTYHYRHHWRHAVAALPPCNANKACSDASTRRLCSAGRAQGARLCVACAEVYTSKSPVSAASVDASSVATVGAPLVLPSGSAAQLHTSACRTMGWQCVTHRVASQRMYTDGEISGGQRHLIAGIAHRWAPRTAAAAAWLHALLGVGGSHVPPTYIKARHDMVQRSH